MSLYTGELPLTDVPVRPEPRNLARGEPVSTPLTSMCTLVISSSPRPAYSAVSISMCTAPSILAKK